MRRCANAVQVPLLDPLLLVPAMAAATTHLGFGVTCATGYEPAFLLARRFSTLDHLTRGRIGWNIVTGYLDSAARAMGRPAQGGTTTATTWRRSSWATSMRCGRVPGPTDAVKRDRAAGVYADPARVRTVRRPGMEAIHLVEPSPQRTPVLYQAGASDRGRAFAARHAECVFVNGGTQGPCRAAGRRPARAGRAAADPRSSSAPRWWSGGRSARRATCWRTTAAMSASRAR